MEAILDVINTHEALIYSEFEATIEMLSGAIFIAIIAGFFIGITLYNLKRVNGFISFLTLPLRIAMFVLGGYPVIALAVLLVPFLQSQVGTIIGIEAAQPILMISGAFYFATLLYRAFANTDDEDGIAGKVIKSLRSLVLMLISSSAVLGMIGMGGLGGILLNYGFFRFNYPFAIVIAVIYAVMVLVVEFAALLLLTIMSPIRTVKATQKAEKIARTVNIEKTDREKAETVTQEPQSTTAKQIDIDSLIRRR